jgi:hypothetical protein
MRGKAPVGAWPEVWGLGEGVPLLTVAPDFCLLYSNLKVHPAISMKIIDRQKMGGAKEDVSVQSSGWRRSTKMVAQGASPRKKRILNLTIKATIYMKTNTI